MDKAPRLIARGTEIETRKEEEKNRSSARFRAVPRRFRAVPRAVPQRGDLLLKKFRTVPHNSTGSALRRVAEPLSAHVGRGGRGSFSTSSRQGLPARPSLNMFRKPRGQSTGENKLTYVRRQEPSLALPVVKVALVGDSQVGKTSLMVRYVEGAFDETQLQTQGRAARSYLRIRACSLDVILPLSQVSTLWRRA